MRFLKAITNDGTTELFNLDQVLTIKPDGNTTKILMGAGLYWWFDTDSIELVECYNELKKALK